MLSASILQKKKQKEKDKETYELRREQVKVIKGKIGSVCDDHVSSINKNIDNFGTQISQSIKGIRQVATLTGQFSDKKEKYSNADTDLSRYSGNLSSEITDCNTKIGELDTQIHSLKSQYKTALNDEKEEAKKLLEQKVQ